MDISGMVSVRSVVSECKVRSKKVLKDHDDQEFFLAAVNGVKELNLYHLQRMRIVSVDVDFKLQVAPLPNDLVSLDKVGINDRGRFFELSLASDMIPTSIPDLNGVAEMEEDRAEGLSDINKDFYPTYAKGGHNKKGYYKHDKINNRLILLDVYEPKLIIRYLSTGVPTKGFEEFNIPTIAKNALVYYILSEVGESDPDVPVNIRGTWENKKIQAIDDLRTSQLPTANEYYDNWRENSSFTLLR